MKKKPFHFGRVYNYPQLKIAFSTRIDTFFILVWCLLSDAHDYLPITPKQWHLPVNYWC
ncbi:hypothetical protein [Mucilaginibacter psychrotolerans]|uniref:hypothetical protein n=1 Tax=Mucilaginibacter psychrotolerans TaxID=1524096 RepID=UPI00130511A7|nr:hypothetical protein [Mucilaginibacter psychrotolerans]